MAKESNAKKVLATMLAASMAVGNVGTIALADEAETAEAGVGESVEVSAPAAAPAAESSSSSAGSSEAAPSVSSEPSSSSESASSESSTKITVDSPETTAANQETVEKNEETADTNDEIVEKNDETADKNEDISGGVVENPDLELKDKPEAPDTADKSPEDANSDIRDYNSDVDEYNDSADKYNDDVDDYNEEAEAYNENLQAEYEQAKQEYEDAKAAYEEELKKYEADSKQYETDSAAYEKYLKEKEAYDKAYADYLDKLEAYQKDKDKYDAYLAAKKEYDEAFAAYETAHNQWIIESGIYNDVIEYNQGIKTSNDKIAADNEKLKNDIQSGTVDDASQNNQAITDNVNTAKTVNESVLKALAEYATIQTEKEALVALKEKIEAYSGKIGDSGYAAYLQMVKDYNAAVDAYNAKITAYNNAVSDYNKAVNEYNASKDTLTSDTITSETGTADWGNIVGGDKDGEKYGYATLSHIDVKYSAASTKTAETVDGKTVYTDTVTGYTVVGVYPAKPTEGSTNYGVNYFSNGAWDIASLNKGSDEFSHKNTDLSFNGNSDTISFYMVVQDLKGNKTGIVVNLDPTSVYPQGTYYNGSNYRKLANYRDSEGNSIPTVTIDGKTYYDISGMSIFVVSAMTCDRFDWSKDGLYGSTDGLDLVLSLQTLFNIHKQATEKTLAFLSLESKLTANAEKPEEPKFTQKAPTVVPEPEMPELTMPEPTPVDQPTAPTAPVFDKTEPTVPSMLTMLESVAPLDKLTEYEEVTVEIPEEEDPVEEEPEEEAEAESEDDALPQTGQDWATVALLALGGMFVTAIGWIRRKLEEHA